MDRIVCVIIIIRGIQWPIKGGRIGKPVAVADYNSWTFSKIGRKKLAFSDFSRDSPNISRTSEFDDWFEAEDDVLSKLGGSHETQEQTAENTSEQRDKTSRQDDNDADIEVFLGAGPMISPDIVIGKFTDSKVTVDEAILEAHKFLDGNLTTTPRTSTDPHERTQDVLLDSAEDDIFDNEIEDKQLKYHKDIKIIKKQSADEPCHAVINGTSGSFEMNFNDDCTVLLASPIPKTRMILHCESMRLPSCNVSRDALTINLLGDMRFGRNSYFYCGKSQIRATTIRRRMSIRIRRTKSVNDNVKCHFLTRQQRFISNFLKKGGNTNVNTGDCGRLGRASKIIGGKKVPPGLFPWAAQLDITRSDGSQTACTGSLIGEKFVLTAAHCLKRAESVSVYMGGADRLQFTGSEITVQAEKYVLHRRWNPKSLTSDLALVKLSEPIKFTDEVSPVCLQEPESLLGLGIIRKESWVGKTGVSVGWGRVTTKETAPRRLYRVRLPFMTDRQCQRIYASFYQKRSMLCTDSTTEAAICYGDSGGPLMYKRNDVVYQVGVASFSLSKKCGQSPDVFTKVSEFSSWIKTRMQTDT
ncbi:unnamed protein product [Allacma fusca]|uniref:Peptidase S1 domain-containing protein n=1 Tax=Allacma fusca TaxID=39272 RepID=A0A8J2JD68_9HEXA|nr:unnamed protein product [Allacma fusca]